MTQPSSASFSRKLAGFGWLMLGLGACQAVAGIEERKLDPDAAAAHPASAQCKEYCTTVMANCTDDNAVYTTPELCLGVCEQLPPGDLNEPTEVPDSVACRKHQADLAEREPSDHCKAAGPGGNGECGSDCDAYCTLFPKVCKGQYEYESNADCLQACSGLIEQDSFNVVTDHGGDTIECRLVHVSSATVAPADHCPHAPIPPSAPWCTGAPKDAPTCEQYCKIELAACTGDLAQYESDVQCEKVCAALDPGTNDDTTGNTVGCRRYHSFSATLAATTHCYHSGPSGDGHCGDPSKASTGHTGNCDSYCKLAAAACPKEFAAGPGTADECMAECVKLPEAEPDSKYTLQKAADSTGLQCRILHTVKAFEDPTACASALGGDQCK